VPDEYRQALVSTFPQFATAGMAVAGRGWHSIAIEIDGRLIAKFPQGAEAETALRREASLLGVVRAHVSLPVPDMVLHEGPPLFSLHRKLPGDRLERDDYLQLTARQRQRLAEDLAGFFADLHALPAKAMRRAGARPVEWWDTRPATLEPVWKTLPGDVELAARAAVEAYRQLPHKAGAASYGFFDAHGWNMAFDRTAGRLNGIYDFADSGFGPLEREFVQVSLTHPELAARTIAAYERLCHVELDRRRIFLMTAAQRLSELAGALETGEHVELVRGFVLDWFGQTHIRPWRRRLP
jgi:aminoglycoside phosphotransferase (APT) family kinase protein